MEVAIRGREFNRTLGHAPILMSLMALALVAYSTTTGSETKFTDEGPATHAFQLLIFTQPVLVAGFLATANWKKPLRVLGMLVLQAVAAGLALGALWYFEAKTVW